MRNRLFILFAAFLIANTISADISSRLNLETQDGSVNTWPYKAIYSNGSLTDNGDGTVNVNSTGGSGGASSLQTTISGVQISSPTSSLNFYGGDFLGSVANSTTAQVYLSPSTTDFIHNASAVQSATLNIASGTVNTFNVTSIQYSDGSIQVSSPSASGGSSVSLASTQTWTGQNNWTTIRPSTFTYGVVVGTLTTNGLLNKISTNGTVGSVANNYTLGVYNANSSAAQTLLTVGSNQQIDQFVVQDSRAVQFVNFGIRAGETTLGNNDTEKLSTVQDAGQFLNIWNGGEIDLESTTSGSGGKDIVMLPQAVESMRFSNTKGVLVSSSMTITGAGLSVSTVTYTPSLLFASLGTGASDGTIRYCSDCTVVTPASCSTASISSCICAGSGSGAFAKHINGSWYCN